MCASMDVVPRRRPGLGLMLCNDKSAMQCSTFSGFLRHLLVVSSGWSHDVLRIPKSGSGLIADRFGMETQALPIESEGIGGSCVFTVDLFIFELDDCVCVRFAMSQLDYNYDYYYWSVSVFDSWTARFSSGLKIHTA